MRITDPMAYNCNILLGKIVKVSGFEGAVTLKLERSFIENIPHLESVFIEIDSRPVPFFIEKSEYTGSDVLRLKFRYYEDPEMVSGFRGCKVFLTSGEKSAEQEEEFSKISGFLVLDEENSTVGQIKEIVQNPRQLLLNIVSPEKKEILIPLHEDLVADIDYGKRVIKLRIPEGLTGIN